MGKNIGFVGLGTMGLPMAANLKKAGFEAHRLRRLQGRLRRGKLGWHIHGADLERGGRPS